MKTKPLPKQYYDIQDLLSYLKVDRISDIIGEDIYPSNGEMITIYEPYEDEEGNKDTKWYKNQQRIFDEFGEIEVKVWW
jgi:hypothetical protein